MPRKKSTEPKVGALKKELRELRSTTCRPISKMKKEEVLSELGKYRTSKTEKVEEKVEAKVEEKPVAESKMKKAVEELRKVETETKGRNIKRKNEGRVAKAMEGLRKVEAETKERNVKRKIASEAEGLVSNAKKINEVLDLKKKNQIASFEILDDVSDKEFKLRKAVYNTFPEEVKKGIKEGFKKKGMDITTDNFIKSKGFCDLIDYRNKTRRAKEKSKLVLNEDEKKEDKMYAKLSSDTESVESASDVEEAPKSKPKKLSLKDVKEIKKTKKEAEPSATGKKPKFIKGSQEAKDYMASIRAKKGK